MGDGKEEVADIAGTEHFMKECGEGCSECVEVSFRENNHILDFRGDGSAVKI